MSTPPDRRPVSSGPSTTGAPRRWPPVFRASRGWPSTAIDLATGLTSHVIVGLDYSDRIPDGFFPFGSMSGVAVGERSIYVSDDGVNQVYEFRRPRSRR